MSAKNKPAVAKGELEALQDDLEADEIAQVETVTDEIETVISESGRLQRFDYIVGEVSDFGVSKANDAHFKLTQGDQQIHCVIFESRRSSINTSIQNGKQIAVSGGMSYYAPQNRCSIKVDDAVPVDGKEDSHPITVVTENRRVQVALAALVLIAALAILAFIVL